MNKVVVVIDMQNDFVDGSLGTTEAQKIVPHVKTEVEASQKAGASLVFTMDTHGKNYLERICLSNIAFKGLRDGRLSTPCSRT